MAQIEGFRTGRKARLRSTIAAVDEANPRAGTEARTTFLAPGELRLLIEPGVVLRVLLVVVAGLAVAGVFGELARNYSAEEQGALLRFLRVMRRNFAPSGEQTVGTWFTASTLLGCGLLLLVIAGAMRAEGGRFVAHWRGLSAIFFFLSCDEVVSIHEQLGDWVAARMETGGVLLWAWVIPYGVLALAVAAAYLPFAWKLPARTRTLFLAAGAIYTGGALVIEMIEAGITDARGHGGGIVTVLAGFEEAAEMLGAVLFLYALLVYLVGNGDEGRETGRERVTSDQRA